MATAVVLIVVMLFDTPSVNTPSRHSSQRSIGEELASLSYSLAPLMWEHRIRLEYGETAGGSCIIADATKNPTNAYKVRGALASAAAAKASGKRSICTASAGNHGAGLAYAAQLLGIRATIYVPENAPAVKLNAIESFGASIIRAGGSFDECLAIARSRLTSEGAGSVFIHPFDEDLVVAGQGTIGLELLEHLEKVASARDIDRVRVFLPIGGGGLASGVASTLKSFWPRNLAQPEIVGVIDESSPASLIGTYFGRPVRAIPDTIADGTRVALVGNTFIALASLVDKILLVPHDAIVDTMRRYHAQTGAMLEPSGALALAGDDFTRRMKLYNHSRDTLSFALISGRNIDPAVFQATVSEHARLNLSAKARIAYDVVIPEEAGLLKVFLRSVREFNIAGLTYKQQPNSLTGTLRVEFEVKHSQISELDNRIISRFPGSKLLSGGRHALFTIGMPVANEYQDELVTLKDYPGSFLCFIENLERCSSLGSVGFLFYRKPALKGSNAQVIIGRSKLGK